MISYHNLLMETKDKGIDKPQIPTYIGECIILICENLSKKLNFAGYTPLWKQEMVSDGIIDCISAVDNFDHNKTNNPFAYFTQIAWNAFIRRIHKEKRQTYIKHKNFENLFLTNDIWEDNETIHLKTNDYSSNIISSYENGLVKAKKQEKKVGFEKLIEVNNE